MSDCRWGKLFDAIKNLEDVQVRQAFTH
jgi:hypothetical protein